MGGQNSLLAFLLLFLLTLLPCKGWADPWTDPSGSGLVLEYTDVEGGVSITKITNAPSTLIIPSKIDEKSVVAIGESVYSSEEYTSLLIPASVKSIGNGAFADGKLSSITMEGATPCTLGTNAFGAFSSYSSIYIPLGSKASYLEATSWSNYQANLEELITDETGNLRFKEYKQGELYLAGFVTGKSAESITIPATITVNGQELPVTGTYSSAFTSKNISSVTFAKDSQLKVIGQGAFSQTSLTKVTIPASVTKMEAMAFGSCNSLTTVIMESATPCTLTYAPFRGCSSDLKIYVPVGTVEAYKSKSDWSDYKNQIFEMPTPPITDKTGTLLFEKNTAGDGLILKGFVDGKSATSITIPATVEVDGTAMPVKEIGESAFNGNRSLTSVDFSEASNLTTISKYAFANTTALQSITIPESVTSIGEMAFMGSTVSEVNFPEEGNLELGSLSFAYTLVSELTIPKSVKKLSEAAFGACSLLKTVNMESDEPCTLGDKAFCNAEDGSFDEGFNIYVPKDKVEAYQSAWTSYQEYIGVKPATTITSGDLKYELNADGTTVTCVGLKDADAFSVNLIEVPAEIDVDGTKYKVTAIADNAFENKIAKQVIIGENVASIGADAFGYSGSNLNITFKGTVPPTLGNNALGSVDGVHVFITVPTLSAKTYSETTASGWGNYSKAVKGAPFDDGDFYFTILDDNTVAVIGYKGTGTEIEIPSEATYNGKKYDVVRMMRMWNQEGFTEYKNIVKITIPTSVKTIDENIFPSASYSTLEEIDYLCENPTSIGNQNFITMAGKLENIYVHSDNALELFKAAISDNTTKDKVKLAAQPVAPITIVDDGETGITSEMADKTYAAGQITYKRTFSQAGQYGTIALPFNVASSEWNEYFDAVYTVSGAESMGNGLSKLKFQEVEQNATLYAKDAYFVKLKDGVLDVTLTNAEETQIVAVPMVNCHPVSYDDNDGTVTITPHASWQKVDGNDTQYYTFNADGTFGKSDYVVPFRMCLTIETSGGGNFIGAPAFFSIELPGGSTTGINGVSAEKASKNAAIYSIDGKLVRANGDTKGLAKGVYIIGGKKIVVK